MSDIPPKSSGEYLDPQDTEEPPIRRRGIRAGKSAKRKRDASIRNALLFTDITDSALIPVGASFVHLSRLDTAVFQFEHEIVKVEEETPETPAPGAASSSSARPPSPPTPTLTPTPKTKDLCHRLSPRLR